MNTFALKLVGAVLVALSSVLIGERYRTEIKSTLAACGDAIRFVAFAADSISYRRTPVSEIVSAYVPNIPILSDFYRRAAETSLSDELKRLPSPFDQTTHKIFLDFASQLGHSYTDSQLELCELTQSRLREHYSHLQNTLKAKTKTSFATGAFIAASIILILI